MAGYQALDAALVAPLDLAARAGPHSRDISLLKEMGVRPKIDRFTVHLKGMEVRPRIEGGWDVSL